MSNDSECPANLKCKSNVWVKCNACSTNPQWKLKLNKDEQPIELFDLRSNPEEDPLLNCLDPPYHPAFIGQKNEIVTPTDAQPLTPGWRACVNDPTCTTPY